MTACLTRPRSPAVTASEEALREGSNRRTHERRCPFMLPGHRCNRGPGDRTDCGGSGRTFDQQPHFRVATVRSSPSDRLHGESSERLLPPSCGGNPSSSQTKRTPRPTVTASQLLAMGSLSVHARPGNKVVGLTVIPIHPDALPETTDSTGPSIPYLGSGTSSFGLSTESCLSGQVSGTDQSCVVAELGGADRQLGRWPRPVRLRGSARGSVRAEGRRRRTLPRRSRRRRGPGRLPVTRSPHPATCPAARAARPRRRLPPWRRP